MIKQAEQLKPNWILSPLLRVKLENGALCLCGRFYETLPASIVILGAAGQGGVAIRLSDRALRRAMLRIGLSFLCNGICIGQDYLGMYDLSNSQALALYA